MVRHEPGRPALKTSGITVKNNSVFDGGKVFHSAAGILVLQSGNNTISHNDVHDFFYTGSLSAGSGTTRPATPPTTSSPENLVHDIGRGLLDDMGGIYMLGNSPGTTVVNNVVHDVHCCHGQGARSGSTSTRAATASS